MRPNLLVFNLMNILQTGNVSARRGQGLTNETTAPPVAVMAEI